MLLHRVTAVNTAADSENRVHDDRVAAAYGFRGGLVPGVTVYGYMTLPVLEHFGECWLERGAMSVRFKAPVYEGEDVAIEAHASDAGRLEVSLENGCATGAAWIEPVAVPPGLAEYPARPMPPEDRRPPASHETLAAGTVLGTLTTKLNLDEARMSAPLPAAVGEGRAAHPAILLALSNELLVRNVVLGPWIHASSEVVNFSQAHDGETLTVHGHVAEKYARKGHEFVVLDVLIRAGERVVQRVRHTAIWSLQA
jgi:acyl dehydratase